MKDTYMVITMDVIASSKLTPNELKKRLEENVNTINTLIPELDLDNKFYISRGDELQIIMPFNDKFGEILMITFFYICDLKLRYGISVGKLDGELKENSWDMNGEIFWNARDALDDIKKSKVYSGKIKTNYEKTDKVCNEILQITNLLINKITDKQWVVVLSEILNTDKKQVLEFLKISESSYYDRIKLSNLKEILKGFDAIYTILENRSKIK